MLFNDFVYITYYYINIYIYKDKKELATGTSAEAAPAAPPLVSSYVLSDIEQPAAVPDPSEDAKVACV